MNDLSKSLEEPVYRCPTCDSVVPADATRCLMCGTPVQLPSPVSAAPPEPSEAAEAPFPPPSTPTPTPVVVASSRLLPEVVESVMRERQSPAVMVMTAVFAVLIIILSALVLRFQGPVVAISLVPSPTPIPPTPTFTPTWTPLPTETPLPSDTPTITPTPAPTDTPSPPRLHTVTSGDTLFGLALRFRVSAESIAAANGFNPDAPIQVGQNLAIPWPTPTPPLVPIAIEVRGELVVADPTNCERYQVQSGDSLSGIAARFNVDYALLRDVNRLTDETILQPGDTICVPAIVFGATLAPTPGPSPTPSATPPPPGPHLLYPVAGTTVETDTPVVLQWAAVKDLEETEWYMVELTDMNMIDSPPRRGFTRDNAFTVPSSWRPTVVEPHQMRWRVSIVQVTGRRSDGNFIYTYGGESSADAFFTWLGAIPTPTPTPTHSATPEP